MAEAKRDQNRVNALLAVDITTNEVAPVKADHATGYMLILIYPEIVPPTGGDGGAIRDKNRVTSELLLGANGDLGNWMADENQHAYITNALL